MDHTNSPDNIEKERIQQRTHELVLRWVRPRFTQFQQVLEGKLFKLADKADNNVDQARLFQTRSDVMEHQASIGEYFINHLTQAHSNYCNSQSTATDFSKEPDFAADEDSLSILDNAELEESLAIGSMSRRRSSDASELLYALNHRLSALHGGIKIDEYGNPIAPAVFAEGIQKAITDLTLDNQTRLVIYKIYDAEFMNNLAKLYEETNTFLAEQGILPNLGYTVSQSPSGQSAPTAKTSSNDQSDMPEELQALNNQQSLNNQVNLFEAIRALQLQYTQENPAQPLAHSIPLPQIVSGLQQLQRRANALLNALETPQDVAQSNHNKYQKQAVAEIKKNEDVDQNIIEIVGLLFKYMLNDKQLPDSIKALLSYLHTPFLKIAIIDKDFFDHPGHPARQLLNSLVAAGERWVEPTSHRKNDIYHQIKNIVERILKEFDNDVHLFSELVFEFNQYLRQHARRIRLAEKRASQAAQGENKLKEIRLKINTYLEKKTEKFELPESARTILFESWSNYLSFNLLRFGSRSEQWREAGKTIDDILWFIQPHNLNDPQDKKRIDEIKASLPAALQKGFDTVGYDNSTAEKLLTDLMQHQEAIATHTPVEQQTPILADIDKVDISKPSEVAAKSDPLIMKLKKVEFGTWFILNADTKQEQRVKLAWSNINTLHFMFVNRMGQQVAIKTGSQLVTELREGSTKMLKRLEQKPFFEQAMERVLDQLKQREETESP